MKITKYGHSCVLVEDEGAKVLVDPGNYSSIPDVVPSLDAILSTHAHSDHLDTDAIARILALQPGCAVYGNSEIVEKLREAGIVASEVRDGDRFEAGKLKIIVAGSTHAVLHPRRPVLKNTGYMIGDKIFHPGDSFTMPPKPPTLLCLPIIGSWMKAQEAIDYAYAVKPAACLPIHDAILKSTETPYKYMKEFLAEEGIEFVAPSQGETLTV
jgi:L-ascorbate metabolism protein UlaG (beta-lactamase superfamily)